MASTLPPSCDQGRTESILKYNLLQNEPFDELFNPSTLLSRRI